MPKSFPLLALLTLFGTTLTGQSVPVPPASPAITRADLAASYLRLDQAIAAASLPDSVRAAVNRALDRATLSFFEIGRAHV